MSPFVHQSGMKMFRKGCAAAGRCGSRRGAGACRRPRGLNKMASGRSRTALVSAAVSGGGLARFVVVGGALPGAGVDVRGGLFGSAGAGSAPPPITGTRGSARSMNGGRFLIRWFRLPCRRVTSMEA
jgi:hypothetical protein